MMTWPHCARRKIPNVGVPLPNLLGCPNPFKHAFSRFITTTHALAPRMNRPCGPDNSRPAERRAGGVAVHQTAHQELNAITYSAEQRESETMILEKSGTFAIKEHESTTEPLPATAEVASQLAHQNLSRHEDALCNWSVSRYSRGIMGILSKFTTFIGPGFLISVAYIDPGNYATDVAAGAKTKFALLFVVLMSNLFAIFLQSLSIKLGSVTGLNLAENCKAHLPKWCTIVLYILAEAAIIATDIAEVSDPLLCTLPR